MFNLVVIHTFQTVIPLLQFLKILTLQLPLQHFLPLYRLLLFEQLFLSFIILVLSETMLLGPLVWRVEHPSRIEVLGHITFTFHGIIGT